MMMDNETKDNWIDTKNIFQECLDVPSLTHIDIAF